MKSSAIRVCCATLLILLFTAVGDASAYYRFDAAASIPCGEYPYRVVAGDVNGDVWLDCIVVNYPGASPGFTVLLGAGEGDFRPPIHHDTGVYHSGITIGQFDPDGHVDLALVNAAGGAVVYRGLGDGTFKWVADHAIGTFHADIVSDDFDEDGNLDLVLLDHATGTGVIYTLLGDGYDGFAYSTARVAGYDVHALTTGDFDGDGHVDLAVAAEGAPPGGEVTIFMGVGDGSFTPLPEILTGGTNCASVAATDLDGDTILDLVVANRESDDISVLMGIGGGAFGAPDIYPVPSHPNCVVSADLDGDGHMDVAVTSETAARSDLTVLFGAGDGTVATPTNYSTGRSPACVAAGDFTGNLAIDLIVANFLSDNVSLHRNIGDGTFMTADYYPAGGRSQHAVVTNDFDKDGFADLAVVNTDFDHVTILTGSVDGVFSAPTIIPVGGTEPYDVTCADFDGDENLDLATANGGSDDISILLGDGHGNFALFDTPSGENVPYAIINGDYDGDGCVDLAVANAAAGVNDLTIFMGDCLGNFTIDDHYETGDEPRDLVAADFYEDGYDDIAVVNFSSGTLDVTLLLGDGNGNFSHFDYYRAGGMPNAITADDFNEDTFMDLAVTNSFDDDVSVLLGLGDGTFAPEEVYGVGKEPQGIITVDINMDGELDLVVANGHTDNISILRGAGDGTFTPEVGYVAGLGCTALVAGQFDGNGFPDLAVANWGWFNVAVFLNLKDVSAVRDEEPVLAPVGRGFARCYPNPSNPRTTLEFDVLQPGRVTITIYDVAGRKVLDLVDKAYAPGRFDATWKGTDAKGRIVGSGVYFAKVVTDGYSETVRMVVIR